MHCPQCGQQQISDETRFCSRCGFLLAGIAEVIASDGLIPGTTQGGFATPRKRGLKQGLFIFLLSFLIVPIVTIISIRFKAGPFAAIIFAILLTVGGLLRMAYALMFESNSAGERTIEEKLLAATQRTNRSVSDKELPPQQTFPASDYISPAAGAWRDTNELQKQPASVTENTTRLLQKEQDG